MALQHVVFNELLSMGKILAKRSGMNTKLIREPEERQGLELSGDKGGLSPSLHSQQGLCRTKV